MKNSVLMILLVVLITGAIFPFAALAPIMLILLVSGLAWMLLTLMGTLVKRDT